MALNEEGHGKGGVEGANRRRLVALGGFLVGGLLIAAAATKHEMGRASLTATNQFESQPAFGAKWSQSDVQHHLVRNFEEPQVCAGTNAHVLAIRRVLLTLWPITLWREALNDSRCCCFVQTKVNKKLDEEFNRIDGRIEELMKLFANRPAGPEGIIGDRGGTGPMGPQGEKGEKGDTVGLHSEAPPQPSST